MRKQTNFQLLYIPETQHKPKQNEVEDQDDENNLGEKYPAPTNKKKHKKRKPKYKKKDNPKGTWNWNLYCLVVEIRSFVACRYLACF